MYTLCQKPENIPLIKQSITLTQDPRAEGDLFLIEIFTQPEDNILMRFTGHCQLGGMLSDRKNIPENIMRFTISNADEMFPF